MGNYIAVKSGIIAITIALLRGALAKIARLEESEGAEPLDDAISIARNALLTA